MRTSTTWWRKGQHLQLQDTTKCHPTIQLGLIQGSKYKLTVQCYFCVRLLPSANPTWNYTWRASATDPCANSGLRDCLTIKCTLKILSKQNPSSEHMLPSCNSRTEHPVEQGLPKLPTSSQKLWFQSLLQHPTKCEDLLPHWFIFYGHSFMNFRSILFIGWRKYPKEFRCMKV